jgi:uncharacterized protein YeaO (DUF488 family)
VEPDDGLRILICRYRPRGVSGETAPWQAWCPALAPSKSLHAAAYGKSANPSEPGERVEPLEFSEYERRFLAEMEHQSFWLSGFAARVAAGDTLTLLCSSACTDEARCHRSLVKRLIEREAVKLAGKATLTRRSRADF